MLSSFDKLKTPRISQNISRGDENLKYDNYYMSIIADAILVCSRKVEEQLLSEEKHYRSQVMV